mmetsp:Transcript_36076/g.84781  ORF Transcript_36076/g.84781 Transcript_36076/m.84781 type:complete len:236 (-) Transcript_36076:523-1230(-)
MLKGEEMGFLRGMLSFSGVGSDPGSTGSPSFCRSLNPIGQNRTATVGCLPAGRKAKGLVGFLREMRCVTKVCGEELLAWCTPPGTTAKMPSGDQAGRRRCAQSVSSRKSLKSLAFLFAASSGLSTWFCGTIWRTVGPVFFSGNSMLRATCATRQSAFHFRETEVWRRQVRSLLMVRMYSSAGSHATPSTKWSCPRMCADTFSFPNTLNTAAVLSTHAVTTCCEDGDQERSHTSRT